MFVHHFYFYNYIVLFRHYHTNIVREGKDERQIDRPKAVLVSMRKDQTHRKIKMRLLHKLIGIDVLASGYGNQRNGERDWFNGYHVYVSKQEVISRIKNARPKSCFCTSETMCEVHVAFSDGQRNTTVSYLTMTYDTTRETMQDTGVFLLICP